MRYRIILILKVVGIMVAGGLIITYLVKGKHDISREQSVARVEPPLEGGLSINLEMSATQGAITSRMELPCQDGKGEKQKAM